MVSQKLPNIYRLDMRQDTIILLELRDRTPKNFGIFLSCSVFRHIFQKHANKVDKIVIMIVITITIIVEVLNERMSKLSIGKGNVTVNDPKCLILVLFHKDQIFQMSQQSAR